MSPALLLLPVAGILLVLLAVWKGPRPVAARLADADAVGRWLARDLPGFAPLRILPDQDGRAALAAAADGGLAALVAMGQGVASRRLSPADITACAIEHTTTGGRLTLRTADMGWPAIALAGEPAALEDWRNQIEAWRSGTAPGASKGR